MRFADHRPIDEPKRRHIGLGLAPPPMIRAHGLLRMQPQQKGGYVPGKREARERLRVMTQRPAWYGTDLLPPLD